MILIIKKLQLIKVTGRFSVFMHDEIKQDAEHNVVREFFLFFDKKCMPITQIKKKISNSKY